MATRNERERVAELLFYAAVLLLTYSAYRLFQPFLVPLSWAAVLVVCFYPLHRRLERYLRAPWAATASTLIVTLILVLPALAVSTAFVREATAASREVIDALGSGRLARLEQAGQWVQTNILGTDPSTLPELFRELGARVGGAIAGQATVVVRNAVLAIASFIIMLLGAFFFFRDGRAIVDVIRQLLPFDDARRSHILQQTQELIFATVVAGLLIAGLQGLLGGLVFALLGLGQPVFWGVVMAFAALLPFGGSWIVWGPAAVWLATNDAVGRAVILAVLGTGVISLVDNVLRPMLVSGRAQMNGLLIFVGLLGGVAVFGFLGLVLGPIILATAATLLEAYALTARSDG